MELRLQKCIYYLKIFEHNATIRHPEGNYEESSVSTMDENAAVIQ